MHRTLFLQHTGVASVPCGSLTLIRVRQTPAPLLGWVNKDPSHLTTGHGGGTSSVHEPSHSHAGHQTWWSHCWWTCAPEGLLRTWPHYPATGCSCLREETATSNNTQKQASEFYTSLCPLKDLTWTLLKT